MPLVFLTGILTTSCGGDKAHGKNHFAFAICLTIAPCGERDRAAGHLTAVTSDTTPSRVSDLAGPAAGWIFQD